MAKKIKYGVEARKALELSLIHILENPTYKQAYRVFNGMGYPVVPVEMDRYGMDVGQLLTSGADVAYVMPAHQYPTGIVMPVKRRQELLSWAYSGEGRYLIEDDYDSEFRYKGKPIPALQGMDTGGRVIYIGTFSKSIACLLYTSHERHVTDGSKRDTCEGIALPQVKSHHQSHADELRQAVGISQGGDAL